MLQKLVRHRLVQDVMVLYGVQVAGYVLPIVTLPYLTRVLGPANFGLLALGSAMAQYFLVVSEYGFAVTGTRRIAVIQEDMGKVARVYSAIMACKLLLIVLGFLALCGTLLAVPKLRLHWELYILSFLLVVGWGLSPNWFFQGIQRIKFVAYSDYGAKIISVGLIFLLVRKSSDYLIATAVQYGAFVVSACIGLAVTFLVIRLRPVWPRWSDMRESMVEGWPVFLSMASMTFTSSSNTMILGMVATSDQVGYLNGAARLVIAARTLVNPIMNAVYPHMSQLAAKSRAKGVRFLERQLLWTSVPFLAISVGMLTTAPFAIRLLYGPKYAESAVVLQLMSPIPFMYSIGTCFGAYYMLAFGHEKEWSKIIRRYTVLNFVCVFALMTVMRPVRAIAVTTSVTDTFAAVSCALFYWRNEARGKSLARAGAAWSRLPDWLKRRQPPR